MKTDIRAIQKENSMKDGYRVLFEIAGLKGHTYPKKKEVVKSALNITEDRFNHLLIKETAHS